MTEDIQLQPFPAIDRKQVEAVRERLSQNLAYKPPTEINFVMSQTRIICCFDGKTLYITDDNLCAILFFESSSYINACTISDTARYALCQMANNASNDADSGATLLFDVEAKRLIARKPISTGWKGVTHLFIDERAERIWVYYGTKKVDYDFSLQPNEAALRLYWQECSKEPTTSPYILNNRAKELIAGMNAGTIELETAEKEVTDLLEEIGANKRMSQYQLSITYRELGDFYSERGEAAKAVSAYETGLAFNPNLPVKKKLSQERKKAISQ